MQKHPETRAKQLELWSQKVLKYCKDNKLRFLDTTEAEGTELFNNKELNRHLTKTEIEQVMEYMVEHKKAEKGGATRFNVFAESIESIGDALVQWVNKRAANGVVMTVYEVLNDESGEGQPFYKMELEMFRKVVDYLEKKKLVTVMKAGLRLKDTDGLKFK